MDLGLRDRLFVVGGGARGLGRATAEVLVAEGASVVLLGRNADALRDACSALGPRASFVEGDMAESGFPARVRAAVDGPVHGMLMNAGGPRPGDVLSLSDDDW